MQAAQLNMSVVPDKVMQYNFEKKEET